MAMVTHWGHPDFFLTYGCYPLRPDIIENHFQCQTASDRPGVVTRVYQEELSSTTSHCMVFWAKLWRGDLCDGV